MTHLTSLGARGLLYHLGATVLLWLLIPLSSTVSAQSTTISPNSLIVLDYSAPTPEQGQKKDLTSVLKQLEEEYSVRFYFDPTLLEGKIVRINGDNENLEERLLAALTPHRLVFKKLDTTSYVIRQDEVDTSVPALEKTELRKSQLLRSVEGYGVARPFLTSAISQTISGKVADLSNDEPLPGVNILVKGTTTGTVTDIEGNYRLTVSDDADVLVFSSIGYETVEQPINGQSVINLALSPDIQSLSEVVVIGYGTVKKSSLTGAVAKLENDKLDQQPVSRPEESLLGQLPGLSIRQSRARPGENPNISIRGTSSISGSNNPLVVIDGFPGGDLASLNTGDIASIEVLKDASSAAIYGSRASGGVIIVTTKQGSSGKPSFSLNSYYAIKEPTYLYDDVHNSEEAYQYSLKVLDTRWVADGGDLAVPVADRPLDYQPNKLKRTFADTDWQDEVLQNGVIQNYELSARGGNKSLKYYVSGNFMDDQASFIVGDFRRYSLRTNLTTKLSDRLELGLNLYGARTEQRRNDMRMREAIKYPSYVPVYLEEGELALGSNYAYNRYYFDDGTSQVNPVAKALGSYNNYNRFTTQANMYLNINIIEGLDFRSSLGVKYQNLKNPRFRTTYAHKNNQIRASFNYSDNYNILNENVLSYNKDIGKHSINAILGASVQKQNNFTAGIDTQDGSITDNRIQTLNVGVVSGGETFESEWGLISYFGRVNYAFDEKYLVSAAYRTDGSSRFGTDRKWGTFPSISLGWRVDQEGFLQDVALVSGLKVRASYGLTGREPGGLYDPIPLVFNYNYTLGSGNGSLVSGATQGTFGNPELGWESTRELNLGLDLGLFENRVLLTVDAYQRKTTDLLLDNPIPAVTGFVSTTTNVGEISNKGLEIALHTRNLTGPFEWETKLNFTKNVNEVTDLGGLESLPLSKASKGMWFQTKVGQPIGQYFGWVQQGVWMNEEELTASPSFPGAQPGSIRIKDINNDGEINADDRVVLGSYMPDFEFGFINEFRYKNFDLSVLAYGVIGFEVYNFELDYYRTNRSYMTDNQWFSSDDPGDGMTVGNTRGAKLGSTDYYLEDGSYWGLRNINFGYTFPNFLNSARLYFSVQNALLFTSKDFHAYNPEGFTDNSGSLTTRGVNYGSEPLNRTYSLGFNLNF